MQTIYLKDYKKPSYRLSDLELNFDIYDDYVIVDSLAHYTQEVAEDLILYGVDLELESLKVNDTNYTDYSLDKDQLILKNLPKEFVLEIQTKIYPEKNHTGEGLYRSGDIYCTQCEAEGFRRITYFMDRPDVMTKYKTIIRADKKRFPILLSNGNMVESKDLENGRHSAIWEDPFNKPSYLFALVAGDLAVVCDSYKTKSGRDVKLEIFVDHGNENKVPHAMESLKNSMKWDEDRFRLEYDLDIYMIVAVDSFNMGAMENKGLNIFNSAYVLADQKSATDTDFQGIEGVIGHEYFHNWTGNRVTCRDWFQLTLKEGLTVFRDQEFSSDMGDRSVKRIEDVRGLKSHQFVEDQGPLTHPIKPKSFVEINNFYTATIYEKGAEVIRMIHTLLGEEKFQKGMDLYFQRHDGQAVTTEDFVAAMSDASQKDLEHFKVWYDQNGTPRVKVSEMYEDNELTLVFEQIVQTNNEKYDCLHFPFYFSLYTKSGERLEEVKFEFDQVVKTLSFKNLTSKPVLSLNENFCAPVIVEYNQSLDDKIVLMKFCQDDFNRYNATQELLKNELSRLEELAKSDLKLEVNDNVIEAYKALLLDEKIKDAFKAFALSFPTLVELNNEAASFDFNARKEALAFLKVEIATKLEDVLIQMNESLGVDKEFKLNPASMGKRSLRLLIWFLLAKLDKSLHFDELVKLYKSANNMTEQLGYLNIILSAEIPNKEELNQDFFNQWKHETLVVQKWLMTQALREDITLEKMKELECLKEYNPKVPNLLRSLIGRFGMFNTSAFHAADGSGYQYFGDKIIEIDSFNPQIAARLAKTLNFSEKLDNDRRDQLIKVLKDIQSHSNLSNDLKEVIEKNLA